ncbi:MAG: porin family protein [Saprospiraceae bacterium]|nr:porin family protein [Saprospiraceae bacterium]
MKNQTLLIVFIMLLCGTFASAQGKIFAGTNLSFSSNDAESNFGIGPRVGYWLTDNGALVVGVGISSNKNKVTDKTASGFGIGAQYRHCWRTGDNFYFYLAPGVAFLSDKDFNEEKTTHLTIELTPGISYNFTEKWSVNAEMGLLNYTSSKHEDNDPVNQFSVGLNMTSLNFGLWYHF